MNKGGSGRKEAVPFVILLTLGDVPEGFHLELYNNTVQ